MGATTSAASPIEENTYEEVNVRPNNTIEDESEYLEIGPSDTYACQEH